jgi:ABC-type multidrug transport system ATPase subunit
MEEAEFLSDRIGVITEGQVRAIGTSAYLKKQFCDFLVVEFFFEHIVEDFVNSFVEEFKGEIIYKFEGLVKIKLSIKDIKYSRILSFIKVNGDENMKNWSVKKGNLEDVFNYIEKNY